MADTPTAESNGSAGSSAASTSGHPSFSPLVCVVDFHHARGPEVEKWFGVDEGRDPAVEWDWSLLPFMALSDGAHASTEDFSYFTLLKPATENSPATSLFGISCSRQIDSSQLLNRPAEVTRSTVQKAVVVIADSPQFFGMLRERLSVVTTAWFAQREFTDCEILRRFQESLADEKERGQLNEEVDRDQYLGMSLRELIHEFKWQTLVLLKCSLLQYKMLFFGSRCERLCMMQFSLISLIPGLLRNLQDCAGPDLDSHARELRQPTSLKTSDRNSLLSYMGLPLQLFGKGSLYGPYTPLQQLDILADHGTKSYIVGSTNSLLLQQKDRYSDILVNLDEDTINVTSTSLRAALTLSHSDRRWIDFVTQEVNDTWDDANPGRPKTMGYRGSEEFIRLQFEEYLLSMISSVKYHNYLTQNAHNPKASLPHIEGDPSVDFGSDFIDAWMRTENHRLWNANTDSHLFDIVEPRHPCAGGLTIDDVQRRIQQQVQELHLDERFAVGREVLGRNLAAGRDKASSVFNKLYSDMESIREAQRKRAEESKSPTSPTIGSGPDKSGAGPHSIGEGQSTSTVSSVGARAGAYIGSWASWADQKRKSGWGRSSSSTNSSSGNGGGGGGSGWGFGNRKSRASLAIGEERGSTTSLDTSNHYTPLASPSAATSPVGTVDSAISTDAKSVSGHVRGEAQNSISESVLDAAEAAAEKASGDEENVAKGGEKDKRLSNTSGDKIADSTVPFDNTNPLDSAAPLASTRKSKTDDVKETVPGNVQEPTSAAVEGEEQAAKVASNDKLDAKETPEAVAALDAVSTQGKPDADVGSDEAESKPATTAEGNASKVMPSQKVAECALLRSSHESLNRPRLSSSTSKEPCTQPGLGKPVNGNPME